MQLFKTLRFRRLARERQGSMLTEFALVLPGFFIILLGGLSVADALSAYNRVQNVATTVGIMTSRLKSISNKDMVGIAAAARGYMFPFPSENLSILVAAVWVDSDGNPSIQWCERWSRKGTASGNCTGNPVVGNSNLGYWEYGSNITVADLNMPSGILNPGTGLVVTRVYYGWDAPYGKLFPAQLGDIVMNDTFFYSPRADVTLAPPSRDRDSPKPSDSYRVRQ